MLLISNPEPRAMGAVRLKGLKSMHISSIYEVLRGLKIQRVIRTSAHGRTPLWYHVIAVGLKNHILLIEDLSTDWNNKADITDLITELITHSEWLEATLLTGMLKLPSKLGKKTFGLIGEACKASNVRFC